jgi:hypothetical protein
MPTNNVVIRFEAWNQWAKAVVISRLGGLGVVVGVNFYTAQDSNGGNSGNGNPVLHQGYEVRRQLHSWLFPSLFLVLYWFALGLSSWGLMSTKFLWESNSVKV